MSDVTLTEFLLARIAEDEAAADSAFDEPDTPGGYGYTFTGHGADLMVMTVDPARVLAECQSKREVMDGVRGWGFENAILRRLAVPYADHPDYSEDWRP